jgi:chemotaxis protein CheC
VTPLILSAEKRDALQELVNIGMGAAGAALANALGAFVELAVPGLDMTDRQGIATLVDGAWARQEVEAVRQQFFGAFTGESLMVFDGHSHSRLSELLGYGPASGPAERQEAVLDLANVVIGACVNGIAEPFHEVVSFAAPSRLGSRSDVRAFLSRDTVALAQGLVVNVDFKLEADSFRSRVLVFLPEHSILKIDQAITRLLDGLAAS